MAPVKKPKPDLGPTFLRKWRDHRDISQQVAADAITVSRELLSKMEASKSPYPLGSAQGLFSSVASTTTSSTHVVRFPRNSTPVSR